MHKKILRLAAELHDCLTLDELIEVSTSAIQQLVSGDIAAYSEVPLAPVLAIDSEVQDASTSIWQREAPRILTQDSPLDQSVSHLMPGLLANAAEHPLLTLPLEQPETPVAAITDFITQQQFEQTGVYNNFFRQLDMRRQVAICPGIFDGTITGLTVNRSDRDFNQSEKARLTLFLPHVRSAFVRLDLQDQVHRLKQYLNQTEDSNGGDLFAKLKSEGGITDREAEVLNLLRFGMTNPEIARRLGIQTGTVRTHVERILWKLGVPNRAAAAVFAERVLRRK